MPTLIDSTTSKRNTSQPGWVGMASGVVCVVLFPFWPLVAFLLSAWIFYAGVAAQPSNADRLRVAAGWLLAVILCNVLLNWGSFQSGCIAGWQAAQR